jgi:hypothetical protein
LATYGEVRVVVNERGRRAWEWVTEDSQVALESPKVQQWTANG